MIQYAFHPEAEVELLSAALFYESREVGLGDMFLDAVQRAVQFMCQYPEAGSPIDRTVRRVLVGRFPYGVIYQLDSESIQIVAISHNRQRPFYWRSRL